MKRFSGKVAVITGAGSGIGRSLAVQLAQRGCILALADINRDGLQQTLQQVEAIGAVASTHAVDVSDCAAVEAFAAQVDRQHGAVHVLVNNAGVSVIDTVANLSYDDFNWIMDINFWGVVYGTKAFLPYLHQVNEAHIANVSSLLGLGSRPLAAAYSASKFAVRGFTEALKMELAASNIGVTCVHPGGIKTSITENSRIGADALAVSKEEFASDFDKAAISSPEQAAAKIIRGIETNRRRVLIGSDAKIFDWVVRLFPGSYEKALGLEKVVRRRARERAELKF